MLLENILSRRPISSNPDAREMAPDEPEADAVDGRRPWSKLAFFRSRLRGKLFAEGVLVSPLGAVLGLCSDRDRFSPGGESRSTWGQGGNDGLRLSLCDGLWADGGGPEGGDDGEAWWALGVGMAPA